MAEPSFTPELSPEAGSSSAAARFAPLSNAWAKLAWARYPVAIFVVTRASLLLISKLGLTLFPQLIRPGGPPWLVRYPAFAGLCRWDCGWFDRLARHGYQSWVETNFWPLYPLLARGTALIGIPIEFGLLLWSNLAALGAYLLIYRIFTRVADEGAARWGLTLIATYPFAFFHAAGYPESLMLFFSALAILLALEGRHVSAGVALGVGILARHITVFAGAALLAAQLRARGRTPLRFVFHRHFLGLVAPFVVAGVYPLYCYLRFGDALSMLRAREQGWGADAWMSVIRLYESGDPNWSTYLVFGSVPFLGAFLLLRRKEWAELAAYSLVLMAVLVTVGGLGLGRYSASCWPAFLPFGVFLARRPNLQVPVVVMFALFQGMFFYLWAHQHPFI